jgi:dipeptidyl aminopeptidase/acylaminoacyl peptidase
MVLLPMAILAREEPHAPTLVELLSRTTIDAPAISPDSRTVAYLQRETHWSDDAFVSELWMVDVTTGKRTQLTHGRKSTSAAQWSPDGRWLAFLTERDCNTNGSEPIGGLENPKGTSEADPAHDTQVAAMQVWIISPKGGEAWRLTQSDSGIKDFHWSRDGKSIFYTAAGVEREAGDARRKQYGKFEVIEHDYDQTQLWRVDFAAAEPTTRPAPGMRLTIDPNLNIQSFAVSPNSMLIAFSATLNPLLAEAGSEDLYLLDLVHGNAVSKIVGLLGPDREPVFSPDGKQLAFVSSLGQPNYYYANTHVGIVNVDAVLKAPAINPGDVRDLTATFDEDAQAIAWVKTGLYFTAQQKMATHLLRLDPVTAKIQQVTPGDNWIVNKASLTPNGQSVALIAQDSTHLRELYVSATKRFSPQRLTGVTAQVRDWKLGRAEVVSWKSSDGTPIDGVLYKPFGYEPGHRYPLFVILHGGPTDQAQPTLLLDDNYYPVSIRSAYPDQAFLAKGALILEPNYRGSTGHGAMFRALPSRNLGVGDMQDVMSGIDSMIARGIADPDRLAAMGWSEGGYISAFLTTHTDRFRAISVGAGISDWSTYYVSTDITPFTLQYLNAAPWDDPEVYATTSPITTIRRAKTPTLIQHGSEDRRVPLSDAFELYRGLRDENVDARLIIYAGFGHVIDKPKSVLAVEQANLDWFSHYVWGESFPQHSPLYGTSELAAATSGGLAVGR